MFDAVTVFLQPVAAVLPGMSTGNELMDFLNTKWGQYSLIAVFFALIIIYLRVLFGPKGFFREKQWDEWNEEARKQKEEMQKTCEDAERVRQSKSAESGNDAAPKQGDA